MVSMDFGIETIRAAAERLEGRVRRTPLLSSPMLDELCGTTVLVKAEALQLTGSFKIRGALNTLLSLTEAEREAGVLAFSTGNHGQAVAASARMTGSTATIVMPQDAPRLPYNRDNPKWLPRAFRDSLPIAPIAGCRKALQLARSHAAP